MANKSKRPHDANQLAKFIVDMATEDEAPVPGPLGRTKGRATSGTTVRTAADIPANRPGKG